MTIFFFLFLTCLRFNLWSITDICADCWSINWFQSLTSSVRRLWGLVGSELVNFRPCRLLGCSSSVCVRGTVLQSDITLIEYFLTFDTRAVSAGPPVIWGISYRKHEEVEDCQGCWGLNILIPIILHVKKILPRNPWLSISFSLSDISEQSRPTVCFSQQFFGWNCLWTHMQNQPTGWITFTFINGYRFEWRGRIGLQVHKALSCHSRDQVHIQRPHSHPGNGLHNSSPSLEVSDWWWFRLKCKIKRGCVWGYYEHFLY